LYLSKFTFVVFFVKKLLIFFYLKNFCSFNKLIENLKTKVNQHQQIKHNNKINYLFKTLKIFKIENCLTFSYMAKIFFNEFGIESVFFIGVKKTDGIISSHSWVHMNGKNYQPKIVDLNEYDVILKVL